MVRILYICTHNRCRSILSEALTNHLSQQQLMAFSAGSAPVDQVHPLTIQCLQEKGVQTAALSSKGMDDFQNQKLDLVITVCDSAAKESCPVWFGDLVQIHWGLADPSKIIGSEAEIKQSFYKTMDEIESRVQKLMSLNLDKLPKSQWQQAILQTNER